eukprot:1064387-Rhodomonas_salina.2
MPSCVQRLRKCPASAHTHSTRSQSMPDNQPASHQPASQTSQPHASASDSLRLSPRRLIRPNLAVSRHQPQTNQFKLKTNSSQPQSPKLKARA